MITITFIRFPWFSLLRDWAHFKDSVTAVYSLNMDNLVPNDFWQCARLITCFIHLWNYLRLHYDQCKSKKNTIELWHLYILNFKQSLSWRLNTVCNGPHNLYQPIRERLSLSHKGRKQFFIRGSIHTTNGQTDCWGGLYEYSFLTVIVCHLTRSVHKFRNSRPSGGGDLRWAVSGSVCGTWRQHAKQ